MIITDIETSNGVIHGVDAVIIPPADEALTTMPETGAANTEDALALVFAIGAGLLLVGVTCDCCVRFGWLRIASRQSVVPEPGVFV